MPGRLKLNFKHIFTVLAAVLVLFLAAPLVKILFIAGPGPVIDAAAEKEVMDSIFLTMRASFWSTILAIIFGIPLAYLLARKQFMLKRIIEGLIDLPLIIPHTAAGIALLMMWGRSSLFSKVSGINIMGSEAAVTMAMFFVSVPFLINSVKNGFSLVDERYEKTAITLGATPWKAFLTIGLPMVKRPVLSGSVMMWGRGISEFGAIVILAYHPKTAPVLIFERFQNFGLKYAVPVTALLIILSLLIFIIVRIFENR